MSKYPKTLFETFEKLRLNLYKPLIFYIPRSIIPDDKKEYFEAPRFKNYFNTVVIINQKGRDYELKDEASLYYIMLKQAKLDENIFILLNEKETLNENQFDFLLKKYLIQINFYVLISEWFNRNIALHIDNLSDEVKNSFQLQYDVFIDHLNHLKSNYFIKEKTTQKQDIDVVKLIEDEFPELNKILNHKSKTESNKNEFKNIAKAKKEMSIITNQEAEDFLLKTVFKVSI